MTKTFVLALALGATLTATSMTASQAREQRPAADPVLVVNLEDGERGTIVGGTGAR